MNNTSNKTAIEAFDLYRKQQAQVPGMPGLAAMP